MQKWKMIMCVTSAVTVLMSGSAFASGSNNCGKFPTSQFGNSYNCGGNNSGNQFDQDYYGGITDYGYQVGAYEAEILRQVNAERAKHGLQPLSLSVELSHAAYIRAIETTQSFSHTRPDGTKWSTVSEYAKGENIARGHRTVDKVMAAWLTSDGHRANILRQGFKTIGICAYEYNGIMYWVQLFGTK